MMYDILGPDGFGRQEGFAPPGQPFHGAPPPAPPFPGLAASDAFSTPANPGCSPPVGGREILDVFGRPIREPCDASLDAFEAGSGSMSMEDALWSVQQEMEEVVSVPELLAGEPRHRGGVSGSARGASRGRMSHSPSARSSLGLTLRQASRASGGHEQADLAAASAAASVRGSANSTASPVKGSAEASRKVEMFLDMVNGKVETERQEIVRGNPQDNASASIARPSSMPRLKAPSLVHSESPLTRPRPRSAGPQASRFSGLVRAGGDDDDVQPEDLGVGLNNVTFSRPNSRLSSGASGGGPPSSVSLPAPPRHEPPSPKKISAAGAASISAILQVVAKAETLPKQQRPNSEKWVERWGHYNAGHWAR